MEKVKRIASMGVPDGGGLRATAWKVHWFSLLDYFVCTSGLEISLLFDVDSKPAFRVVQ